MTTLEDLRTLRVEEVAELLGVHAESVCRFVRDGRLEAFKVGRRLRIRPAAVETFLESCRVHVPDPADFVRRARAEKTHARR